MGSLSQLTKVQLQNSLGICSFVASLMLQVFHPVAFATHGKQEDTPLGMQRVLHSLCPMKKAERYVFPRHLSSWTGEALDKKTPLLRSIDVVNEQAMRILKIFGTDKGVTRVITTLGLEQEYFLVDESFIANREDLLLCGRNAYRHSPTKRAPTR